jgi:hypothetical protein
MTSASKTIVFVYVLLAVGALACCTSVDLGGEKAPTETPFVVPTSTAPSPQIEVESVSVSLLDEDGEARVPPGRPVDLTVDWAADTEELVIKYLSALDLTVRLDGESLEGVISRYGPVEEHGDGDADGDGDIDYVTHWRYPLGALSSGVHLVEAEFRLLRPVTDGVDRDADGELDEYSGTSKLEVRIIVGD